MRLINLKVGVGRRVLCILLCLMLSCGAMLMTSCNDGEVSDPVETDEATETSTEEIQTEFELNENGLVNVLVFTKDIAKGTMITKSNTEFIELPVTNIPGNIITYYNDAKGKYVTKDFCKGDYVIDTRLTKNPPVVTDSSTITEKIERTSNEFIVVTDFIKANTGEDLYGNLQTLINKNPGRTLFFPDGEYIISQSLETTSDPKNSTSFYFSSGAILKASDDWKQSDGKRALICLGSLKRVNDIRTPGSNFYVMGGIFDGNGRADGISIDAGRETLIKDVLIINTRYGIHIKDGTNSSSSDADIDDVTIIGNGMPSSVGIFIIGLDNTVTNARISNVNTGMQVPNGVFISNSTVENTAGFDNATGISISGGDAWVSNCTSINYDNAFAAPGARGVFKQCTAIWTEDIGTNHIAFKVGSSFRSCIISCRAEFLSGGTVPNLFLSAGFSGNGKVVSPVFDKNLVSRNDATTWYLEEGTTIMTPAPAAKKED